MADTAPEMRHLDLGSGLRATKPRTWWRSFSTQPTSRLPRRASPTRRLVRISSSAPTPSTTGGSHGGARSSGRRADSMNGLPGRFRRPSARLGATIWTTSTLHFRRPKGERGYPFGWSALDLAWRLTQREPIQLLDPSLTGRRVPTAIAGIAYHLQLLQDKEPILLPIDQLRTLLKQRKIVVSGAVQRLVEAKLIDYADKSYHTGKAREFRFVGVDGEQYEKLKQKSSDT